MSLAVLLVVALGLAMDAFAVAIATSIALGDVSRRQTFRLAFHFGLFQALMPVIGWSAGRTVADHIQAWDHWVAFAILAVIGLRSIIRAFSDHKEERQHDDPTRGLSLIMLSVATSIDALAVGLSFAMLRVDIWYAVLVIGMVAGGMTVLGLALGTRIGALFGRRMEAIGGLVLVAIGIKILVEHIG